MQLENSFVVPAGIDAAWSTLLDVEGVAPCLPGATLTGRDGDVVDGQVKVKLGPVAMTYKGRAEFTLQDEHGHRVVIAASGKDTKGTSTAAATVSARLLPDSPARTRVEVLTDLTITGKPAQFGRGVMQDVAARLVDQFAANLAALMAAREAPVAVATGSATAKEARQTATAGAEATALATAATAEAGTPSVEPAVTPVLPHAQEHIDLLEVAGQPLLKRAVPFLAGVVVGVLIGRLLRRRK